MYQSWLGYSGIEQATSGTLVWQLINDGKDDCEGFQVYCPLDAQTCEVLRQASDRALTAPVAVSAATDRPVTLAAGSIATLFGSDLDGAQVTVADAKGRVYNAVIFYSSPQQINFQVPENVPSGGAVIRVVRDETTRASSAVVVAAVEPGLFTASADGKGIAAGLATIVSKGGSPITQFLVVPIDALPGSTVVLSLFGTGIRGSTAVTAKVKGMRAEVQYSGAQGQYVGLDQVNILLPEGLAGSGEVDVELTVGGKIANVVRLTLR